eukprot:2767267-Rhodomonas_salina.1
MTPDSVCEPSRPVTVNIGLHDRKIWTVRRSLSDPVDLERKSIDTHGIADVVKRIVECHDAAGNDASGRDGGRRHAIVLLRAVSEREVNRVFSAGNRVVTQVHGHHTASHVEARHRKGARDVCEAADRDGRVAVHEQRHTGREGDCDGSLGTRVNVVLSDRLDNEEDAPHEQRIAVLLVLGLWHAGAAVGSLRVGGVGAHTVGVSLA